MNSDQEKPDELSLEESQVDTADASTEESLEPTSEATQEPEQSEIENASGASVSTQDSQDVVFIETAEESLEQTEDVVEPEVDPFAETAVDSNVAETSEPEHTLGDVVALLEQLQKDFDRKLKYDSKKDEMVDRLHAENAEYKKDLVWSVKKVLIESFIAEIDDVEKRWRPAKLDEPIPSDPEELAKLYKKLLKYVCRELPDNLRFALESNDVFAYSSEDGVEFDPKTQRAIRTTTTDRPELDKTIKSLRSGYKSVVRGQETFIRPELVEVLKYSGPAPDVSTPSEVALQEPTDAVPQEPPTDESDS